VGEGGAVGAWESDRWGEECGLDSTAHRS
jgi:hypothetical protein